MLYIPKCWRLDLRPTLKSRAQALPKTGALPKIADCLTYHLIGFTFQKFECETHRENKFVANVAEVEEVETEANEVIVTAEN